MHNTLRSLLAGALALLTAAAAARAQPVGIGTPTPNPAAVLAISSETCSPGPPLALMDSRNFNGNA